MEQTQQKRIFINLDGLKNSPSIIKFALTERNDGKTTCAKCMALESFFESGKTAIFARRFSTEFTEDFFTSFVCNERIEKALRGHEYKFEKATKEKTGAMLIKDGETYKRAIAFVPMSKAGRLKSNFDWKTHKNLYYDEFIPLDGRYLKNEMQNILELYKTIDRGHYDNAVYIFGNKITRDNPLFQYFNITRWKNGLNSYQNGALSVLVWNNPKNNNLPQNSRFNDLVRGTDYEEYNAGEFLLNTKHLIQQQHSRVMLCRIADKGKLYGIYYAGASLVVDNLHQGAPPSVTLCVAPQPPNLCAVFLQANDDLNKILQSYKYNNALFFATELIAEKLQKFYKAI